MINIDYAEDLIGKGGNQMAGLNVNQRPGGQNEAARGGGVNADNISQLLEAQGINPATVSQEQLNSIFGAKTPGSSMAQYGQVNPGDVGIAPGAGLNQGDMAYTPGTAAGDMGVAPGYRPGDMAAPTGAGLNTGDAPFVPGGGGDMAMGDGNNIRAALIAAGLDPENVTEAQVMSVMKGGGQGHEAAKGTNDKRGQGLLGRQ